MIFLLLIISVINLVILAGMAKSVLKLMEVLEAKSKPVVPPKKILTNYTIDLPVARQPNYGDVLPKPSTDLKIIKDV